MASKKTDTLRMKRYGNRSMSGRFYKTRFFIVAEGSQTERDYLTILRCLFNIVITMPPADTHSAPNHLLIKAKDLYKYNEIGRSDEFWIILDKDDWEVSKINELQHWISSIGMMRRSGVVLSNPKFEYWLLLHFEEGYGVVTAKECDNRLKRWLKDYSKNLRQKDFTEDLIIAAIERSKNRAKHIKDLSSDDACTNMHELVEHIIAVSKTAPKKS